MRQKKYVFKKLVPVNYEEEYQISENGNSLNDNAELFNTTHLIIET